jgi:hypothetical protein
MSNETNRFDAKRYRAGKTARDRANGYAARRNSNRMSRNVSDKAKREWVNCHGKGNSSVAFKLGSRRHRKG